MLVSLWFEVEVHSRVRAPSSCLSLHQEKRQQSEISTQDNKKTKQQL
jgi:hypothetical protein